MPGTRHASRSLNRHRGAGGRLRPRIRDHEFVQELLIAVNPDEDSRLPLLLRIPQPGGDLLFRTSGTWPRVKALYCYPVGLDEWPDNPMIVERVPLRSCRRRGAAIDVVLDRARENRSQLVFTQGRGRDAVFWQSAHPQASAPERAHPHRPRPRHRRAADRRRCARAVSLPIRHPKRDNRSAGAAVRRLRARPQRPARRPDLFIAGGGISRKADKWLPLLTNRTPVVAAALQNTAGIVGAAVAAQVDRAESARSGRSECTLSLQWSKAAAGPDSGEYP
jgi:hypothetical protein